MSPAFYGDAAGSAADLQNRQGCWSDSLHIIIADK
jgi:hypothetical protein